MPVLKFVGGINEQKDTDINIMECTTGQNFILDRTTTSLKPRLPIDYIATTPNSGNIYSIMQLISRDGTQTQLVKSASTIYSWDLDDTFVQEATSVLGKLDGFVWSLDDYLIITDYLLSQPISYWDSNTFATLDIGLTAPRARYGITHNGRAWFFNCYVDGTLYPNVILASEFENVNNCSISEQGTAQDPTQSFTSSSDPFFLTSPDLKPINGVTTHLGSLVISTFNGKLYRLEGDDATNYNFIDYYAGSSAITNPGAGYPSQLISIGNDVIFVRTGPTIELLSTTAAFGDTATDDISRWIPNEIATGTSEWSYCPMIYDPGRQQIVFFLGNTASSNFRCMVLDKYRLDIVKNSSSGDVLSPWSKYVTDLPIGYIPGRTYALMQTSAKQTNIYMGDTSGNLMKFYGTAGNADYDGTNSENIVVQRSSKVLQGREAANTPVNGEVFYKKIDHDVDLDVSIDFWPSMNQKTATVTMEAAITGGSAPSASEQWTTTRFTPPGRGAKTQVHLETDDVYDFEIESITL